jgi:hypothetical protein
VRLAERILSTSRASCARLTCRAEISRTTRYQECLEHEGHTEKHFRIGASRGVGHGIGEHGAPWVSTVCGPTKGVKVSVKRLRHIKGNNTEEIRDGLLDLILFKSTYNKSSQHLSLIPGSSLHYHPPREDRPSGKEEDDGRVSTKGFGHLLDVTRN